MEELLLLLSLLNKCNTVSQTKVPGVSLPVPITRRPESDTTPAGHAVRKHCQQKEHVVSADVLCTVLFLKDALLHLRDITVLACDACQFLVLPHPRSALHTHYFCTPLHPRPVSLLFPAHIYSSQH